MKQVPFIMVLLFAIGSGAGIGTFVVLLTIHVPAILANDTIELMECDAILTEIQNDHNVRLGYTYIENWIEKECWK